MAPITKKRKVTSTFEPAARVTVLAPPGNGITAFGRVSKPAPASARTGKQLKEDRLRCSADEHILKELSNGVAKAAGVKRKAVTDLRTPARSHIKTESSSEERLWAVQPENQRPVVREIRNLTPEPPSLPRIYKDVTGKLRVKEPDTPTRGTRNRLEAFTITSSPSKTQAQLTASLLPTSSSPAVPTPCPSKKRRRAEEFPDEVQELVDLHASFLSVLSLHYAHNGTSTPADLKTLSLGVGKVWGRRNPTIEDIRRALGVQQRSAERPEQAALLSIWDYGRGRICIEYCEPTEGETWGGSRQPLETQSLSRAFSAYLTEQYRSSLDSGESVDEFISALPLARLHKRATSKAKKSTMLSKGQARLTELKEGAIEAQKRNQPATSATTEAQTSTQRASTATNPAPVALPSQRQDSLLSRIRAKESLLASMPSGPTQEQLDRRSALQRVPDVINVLSLLASNNSSTSSISPSRNLNPSPMSASSNSAKSSDAALAAMLGVGTPTPKSTPRTGLEAMFGGALVRNTNMSLQQVVERVQSSMRTPITRLEVERVIRLLAGEVCPGWIQLREIGSVKGVTIKGTNPGSSWKERAAVMAASCC